MVTTTSTTTLPPIHLRTLVRALDIYRGDAVLPQHHVLDLRSTLNTAAQSGNADVALTPTSARTAETLLSAVLLHAGKRSRKKFAHALDVIHGARRFSDAKTFAAVFHAPRGLILPQGDITGSSIAHLAHGMMMQLRGFDATVTTENLVDRVRTFFTTRVAPLAQEILDRIDALSFSASRELYPLLDAALDLTEEHPQRFMLNERACAALYHAAFLLHGNAHLATSAREICDRWFNDDEERLALTLFPEADGTREEKLSRMLMGFDTLYEHGSGVVALGHAACELRMAVRRKNGAAAERALAVINSVEVQRDDPIAEHARLSLMYEAVRVARHYVGDAPEAICFTAEQLALFQHRASEGLKTLMSALTAPSPPQKPRLQSPLPDDARAVPPRTSAEGYPPDHSDPQSA